MMRRNQFFLVTVYLIRKRGNWQREDYTEERKVFPEHLRPSIGNPGVASRSYLGGAYFLLLGSLVFLSRLSGVVPMFLFFDEMVPVLLLGIHLQAFLTPGDMHNGVREMHKKAQSRLAFFACMRSTKFRVHIGRQAWRRRNR